MMAPLISVRRERLAELLNALQDAMLAAGLWQQQRPCEQALASQQPFAIDSLMFEQWLQFILIEKLRSLLEQNVALPSAMAVSPMAEQVFTSPCHKTQKVLTIIQRIDLLISEKDD